MWFYDLICINYHKYANKWIFQKIEIIILFYTLYLTCVQIFAEILRGGHNAPPPPARTKTSNTPAFLGLKESQSLGKFWKLDG